ncbi:MAG: glucose-1-phosphate thymidylyltransferase RfbA [Calditrichaeota bacterium]|nr:glucose-1-phosphate thymidylyltransferase RfbA [Calditrichota bacterium]
MKGIILAGGAGTRLYPLTKSISKQLLPIYDKPMIYYPLSVLMLAGIREILIISTPRDIPFYQQIFNDGSDFGLSISYKIQPSPDGLAQAFILGREFIANDDVCLILGDNIFYGNNFSEMLKRSIEKVEKERKSVVFGYFVKDPERYGVVEFDNQKNVISIVEKPKEPRSNYAVVGLYFYTNDVVQIASELKPSTRGELEITDINKKYLEKECLSVDLLNRGCAWLDTGTHESLMEASQFVQAIENRTGLKIACIEEIAYRKGWINKDTIKSIADSYKNEYGNYLRSIVN